MLLLCKKCIVGFAFNCSALLVLFQLILLLACHVCQQLAALQCLHLVCLLPQFCTSHAKHLMHILQSVLDI